MTMVKGGCTMACGSSRLADRALAAKRIDTASLDKLEVLTVPDRYNLSRQSQLPPLGLPKLMTAVHEQEPW